MLASLYPASVIWMVATTILWFWFDERSNRRAASRIAVFFGIGLLLYIPALLACEGGVLYKLAWIVPRDAFSVFLAVIISGYIKRNRTFALTLLGFLTFATVFYWGILERSVNFATGLEPTAELLVDLTSMDELPALQAAFPALTFKAMLGPIARPEATELDDYATVDIPRSKLQHLSRYLHELENSALVDEVEHNELVLLHQLPSPGPFGFNDPQASQQWALKALKLDGYTALLHKRSPKKQVLLVVIDTGVNAKHEDLKAHYKSVDNNSDTDELGHGTHCAGIAGAVSGNRKGIASLAGGTDWLRIASVRVFEGSGSTSQAKVLEGMVKAADANADVVSMSLGGRSEPTRKMAYQRAVDYIAGGGGIVVVSAGNNAGEAKDQTPVNCKGVIAVSAIGPDGRRAPFSNTVGSVDMGITAPGVDILSTYEDGYKALSGTSMSAPYVSGLVAVMKALDPDLTAKQAWDILHRTGANTDGGKETGRLIQPVAALKSM